MVIIEAIFPVFIIALVGYLLAVRGVFGVREIEGISRYVFVIAIPSLLFNSLSTIEFPEKINWAFFLSYYLVLVLLFFVGVLLSKKWFGYSDAEQGIFGMGTSYSNLILVGLPLISSGLGEEALLPLFMIVAFHSSVQFFLVTIFAERDSIRSRNPLAIVGRTIRNLASNPIIIGLILGLLVNFLSIPIPDVVSTTIEMIAKSALPISLFVLGASLSAYKLAGHYREAWTIVGLKLFIQPLLVWFLAFIVFRIDPLWASTAVMMAAMPVGINVYMMAQKYHVCQAPISSAIFLSTTIAVLTQSLLLYLFI